jgi:putative methylase
MKLKHLQTHLEDLEGFRDPQIELEQYPTGAHLASQMLYNAYGFGDIEDKVRACITILNCDTFVSNMVAETIKF